MPDKTIRVLIADDEALARDRVADLLEHETNVVIVGTASTGLEAIESIRTLHPDLVFLDVQMPELDGFGVVQAVGAARMPPVVFVTAHDRFAIQAFEINALDSLLKPVTRARFVQALARAKAWTKRARVTGLSR